MRAPACAVDGSRHATLRRITLPALTCPHCGEIIDTFPDPGGGSEQEYIEDCSVCCRPMVVSATLDEETGEFAATASPEV